MRYVGFHAMLPDREKTLDALGFKISPDVGMLKGELAAASAKLKEAESQLATTDAAKRKADAEVAKADAEIVKGVDKKAMVAAEQALVEVELIRNKAEIARTKLKRTKKLKTEAEQALDEAEKAEMEATAKVGGFKNISKWSLWPGATVLVVGGLLALAFQWRTLGRTFASIFAGLGGRASPAARIDHIEIPMRWFAVGFPIAGTGWRRCS